MTLSETRTIDESVDYWRYDVGVNVIPSDTKNKKPLVAWSEWQDNLIPEEVYKKWKAEGAFSKGIAIIPGEVWHRDDKKGLYFIFIDADSKMAINELLTRNGITASLQEVAKKWLVEQHADNPDKAHIYFYSPVPFPKKPADSTLGLEVKGLGEHGIAFCFPSIHRDGKPYEIIGTNQPEVLTDLQARQLIQHIDQICWKHGLLYLEKDSRINNALKNTIKSLKINLTVKIPQGQRHVTLISFADSLLFRNLGKKSEKELRNFLEQINYHLCQPKPLPDSEIDNIWNSAVDFVSRNKEEHNAIRNRIDEALSLKKSLSGDEEEGEDAEGDGDGDGEKAKKTCYIQKFTFAGKLYEAVLIDKKPFFLIVDKENNNKVEVKDSVDLEKQNKTLKPYEEDSYLSKPYEFANQEEIEYFRNEAKKYKLDSIYLNLVKPLWRKYIDADNFHLSLCAFATIFTYFQDLLGLTHYLFFVGNNNSGKSNNLYLLHYLTYRNLMSTDMTSANIFRSLGSMDEGQVTICEDELDNLEDDRDKKRIYVNGYSAGFPVFRTEEGSSSNKSRKPTKYFTYCFKAFAAERLPDVMKAKGFNQRIIELQCNTGFPEYNIKEVSSPAGDETFKNLLDELEYVRKILLMYRLLHYHDGLPNIGTNLKGREKELFQPLLRLFQNTNSAIVELKQVIDHFISIRRESNAQTAHAQIYQSIIRLLAIEYRKSKRKIIEEEEEEVEEEKKAEMGNERGKETEQVNENNKEPKLRLEYPFSDLWDHFVSDLDGQPIVNRNRSADFGELGEMSHKEMSKILIEVFGSKRTKTRAGNKAIILNPEKIIRLGTVYEVTSTVRIGEEVINRVSSIFSDYLTNLTNLVKDRVESREKEV